ncbi:hypothetical protein CUMW_168970 [Citrus unshiu]|uniref:Uncharacterized protein n=1 Tax=Citrus unshiu TaxID=55188 RepID=A0A2H5PUM8_CITUN|nr:hypothetical protein CUMW_168970 [Citrus unshiu]
MATLRLTHAYVYPNHGKINLAKAASSLQRLIEVLLSLISVLLLSSKPYPVHEREQHFSTKISIVGVNEERPAIPVSNNVGCSSYLKHVKECSKNKAEHDHFGILVSLEKHILPLN